MKRRKIFWLALLLLIMGFHVFAQREASDSGILTNASGGI
jgi:hypothetical protein